MRSALYVLKIGSATALSGGDGIWTDVATLRRRGARVLIVAGGADAIRRHYDAIGRPVVYLTLANGDRFRYCTTEDMPHVVAAYESLILPAVRDGLWRVGVESLGFAAGVANLVTGTRSKPLRAVREGRQMLVRDSRVGTFAGARVDLLRQMLDSTVVVLCPPIRDVEDGGLLNIDADMLGADLAIALEADHLRFVTSTPGVLENVEVPSSTVTAVYPDDPLPFVHGRMKQKIRAARHAAERMCGDVRIVGPHRALEPAGATWFWPVRSPGASLDLLTEAVSLSSVSHDEAELAMHLRDAARGRGLAADVDGAGNVVISKGTGSQRLMLLGHLDTVPHRWPVRWRDGALTGRGSVDAKASLIAFIDAMRSVEVPASAQLIAIGATQEEVSSSHGAFYVRDHYRADAVVIGEPSGVDALTLGYFGLVKIRVVVTRPAGHSAGRDAGSALDGLAAVTASISQALGAANPTGVMSIVDGGASDSLTHTQAWSVLTTRVGTGVDPEVLVGLATAFAGDGVAIDVLRATPPYSCPRGGVLPRAFARAFSQLGRRPRYLVKTGTADMNTLATTWRDVEMVAYGPGDAALDHTPHEAISTSDYEQAKHVLVRAIDEWFRLRR